MLAQPHRLFRAVDWVEVMMPFYRGDLFLAAREHLNGNVSSWGLDKYLWPTLQQLRGQTRTAVIDAVTASHRRPITSGHKTYRNGRTAPQERDAMRELSRQLLQTQRPDLVGSDWYRRIFQQRHVRTRWQRLWTGLGRPIRRWLDQST
jgi:6-phosphogluconate dehydrogenase